MALERCAGRSVQLTEDPPFADPQVLVPRLIGDQALKSSGPGEPPRKHERETMSNFWIATVSLKNSGLHGFVIAFD